MAARVHPPTSLRQSQKPPRQTRHHPPVMNNHAPYSLASRRASLSVRLPAAGASATAPCVSGGSPMAALTLLGGAPPGWGPLFPKNIIRIDYFRPESCTDPPRHFLSIIFPSFLFSRIARSPPQTSMPSRHDPISNGTFEAPGFQNGCFLFFVRDPRIISPGLLHGPSAGPPLVGPPGRAPVDSRERWRGALGCTASRTRQARLVPPSCA